MQLARLEQRNSLTNNISHASNQPQAPSHQPPATSPSPQPPIKRFPPMPMEGDTEDYLRPVRNWPLAILLGISLLGLPPRAFAQRYSFKLYSGSQGLGNLATLCLLQDSTGYLWIGTQHGLYRYDRAHSRTSEMGHGPPSAR